MAKRVLKVGVPAALAFFLLIQLVPYGHSHTNPPVTQAAKFPPGPAEQLMRTSCGDCHTNLTKWRWYSNVAPISWLVAKDVSGGRKHLNFSEWNKPQSDLSRLLDTIDSGSMPPLQYTLPRPSSKLSAAEKQTLKAALKQLYASDPPQIRQRGGG
jgi:mono/diheme cytochrome c family protein